jgi:hypothetical protein
MIEEHVERIANRSTAFHKLGGQLDYVKVVEFFLCLWGVRR